MYNVNFEGLCLQEKQKAVFTKSPKGKMEGMKKSETRGKRIIRKRLDPKNIKN